MKSRSRQNLKRRRIAEQDGRCAYCLEPLDVEMAGGDAGRWPTLDHVVARSNGGPDEAGNIVVACRACNAQKGSRDIGPPALLPPANSQLKFRPCPCCDPDHPHDDCDACEGFGYLKG